MWFGALVVLLTAFFGSLLPGVQSECTPPCVPGSEDIMKPKAHGTSETPVQENLRWGCGRELADRICVSRRPSYAARKPIRANFVCTCLPHVAPHTFA